MVRFAELMEDDQFFCQFGVRTLKSKKHLEWLRNVAIPPARYINEGPTDKTGRQVQRKSGISRQLKTRMLNKCDNLMLRELGTEKVRQVVCVSSAVQMNSLKDERIGYMFLQ